MFPIDAFTKVPSRNWRLITINKTIYFILFSTIAGTLKVNTTLMSSYYTSKSYVPVANTIDATVID